MPDISDYTELVKAALLETAKYFSLLVFAVLAIRFWRRQCKLASNQRRNFLMACMVTAMAVGTGYFSICHSLSRLYSYYGTRAFDAGNLPSAISLFQTSAGYWKNADALGKQGVCLLLSGRTNEGIQLINQAKSLRPGRLTTFEEFYEGVHYFFQGQTDQAVPLLEAASADPA
jgi:tetratricopeptide (TPR) repeat protein